MVYAVSDLHGFPLVRFQNGLKSIGFGDNDFLFVLGDVIDRNGDGGVAMLRWLITQPNIQLLLGNHEAMMLSCDFLFQELSREAIEDLDSDQMRLLLHWTGNGGDVTMKGLYELNKREPDCIPDILEYLREAPLYDAIHTSGHDFILTHAGLGNFTPGRKLSEYTVDELIWNRPQLTDRYFEDAMTIFGHTPTIFFGNECAGKVLRTDTWIDIDVNTARYDQIAVLQLDTLREFYI